MLARFGPVGASCRSSVADLEDRSGHPNEPEFEGELLAAPKWLSAEPEIPVREFACGQLDLEFDIAVDRVLALEDIAVLARERDHGRFVDLVSDDGGRQVPCLLAESNGETRCPLRSNVVDPEDNTLSGLLAGFLECAPVDNLAGDIVLASPYGDALPDTEPLFTKP